MELRDYQQESCTRLQELLDDGHDRQTLVLPCGTGKTVVAGALIAARPVPLTVVLVPTVHLLSQTIERLSEQVAARFLAVCSPRRLSEDDVPADIRAEADTDSASSEAELAEQAGERVTTDPDQIVAEIRRPGPLVIVGTYASCAAIAAALQATTPADLLICDEAHHTTGPAAKAWAAPLDQTRVPARRRLFMTATTRIVVPPDGSISDIDDADLDVYSMDDVDVYGPHVAPLSFRAAISAGYLSDYQIAVVAISSRAAADAVSAAHARGDNIDAYAAAAQLALLQHLNTNPGLRSILVFHNRIDQSRRWARQMRRLAGITGTDIRVDHLDGSSDPRHRTAALNALDDPGRVSIVTNCRLFSEGVDVPALDAVMFAGPRTSGPEIVQIVGRAIRPHPSGPDHKALIIVPVLERPGDDSPIDVKVAQSSHLAAWQVLTTLAEEDDYVNEALLSQRLQIDSAEPREQDTSRVTIDTSMLDTVEASDFQLRLVRRTTSHYLLTARKLAVFVNEPGGHTNPPAAYQSPDGYPLGRRVREVRAAYRRGRLPQRIIDIYEKIPGWTWTTSKSRPVRSVDDWIGLIAAHTAASTIRTVHEWEKTSDPATGQPAPIGKWLYRVADGKVTLSAQQRERLASVVTIPGRRRR